MNVGVLGCGVIAHNYVDGADGFPTFDVVACADAEGVEDTLLRDDGVTIEPPAVGVEANA